MLHHILVKWTEEVQDKAALVQEVGQLFEGVLRVPGVHSVRLFPNVIDRPNRYDLLIRIEMEDNALPIYDECEAHHRWKDSYGHLVAKKAIFDCEESGHETV